MSYRVLARKWRPLTFEDLVGQEHVTQTLVNSLLKERLHHAYLFTGTRGVGKTTVARILAKSLNCLLKITPKPCGKCEACLAIDEGRFVDLIEVDAASRTKVEQTRELLENVLYAPTNGRYKVYLIDEVHMLSTSSFNALLETLEEPPDHVKFLLATTESSKIPVTVLSRCLQFNLKAISINDIQKQLIKISNEEGFDIGSSSLLPLAVAARGSMRDALSLLDQAISFSGGAVTDAVLNNMLGVIDKNNLLRMIKALAQGDGVELIKEVNLLDELSPDYFKTLDEFMVILQKIAVLQLIDSDQDDAVNELNDLAHVLSKEDVQLYYQIALNGLRDLSSCIDVRSGFEMTLLRMLAFRPAESNIDKNSELSLKKKLKSSTDKAIDSSEVSNKDESILSGLNASGMAKLLVDNSNIVSVSNEKIELIISDKNSHLSKPEVIKSLELSLKEKFKNSFRVIVSIGNTSQTNTDKKNEEDDKVNSAAKAAILSDPNIKAIEDEFDAIIESDSIKPN